MHVEHVNNSLVKYFCIFNHVKTASNTKQSLTNELLLMNYINNCLCWKCFIFIMSMCCHLLMNADLAGVQLCFQTIITCEKQGTISDKMIVFMCLWQEPISVKVVVQGYGMTISTWLTNTCISNTLEVLSQNILLKYIGKFNKFYKVLCAYFPIVMILYSCAPCRIIRL